MLEPVGFGTQICAQLLITAGDQPERPNSEPA